MMNKGKVIAGVISDTHGLLRPQAVEALKGVDLIFHAGDIGGLTVFEGLREIAPVIAVRGNTDHDPWTRALSLTETYEVNNKFIHVIHDLTRMDLDPAAAGFSAVINGHTHIPLIYRHEGVIFINPGSAGPKRGSLPVSVAILHLRAKSLDAEIIRLEV